MDLNCKIVKSSICEILYEDNHLIAVAKKAGDIVQGDKTGDVPLSDMVKAYLKEKYHKPGEVFLGVVHRLDRPVSGVVLSLKLILPILLCQRQVALDGVLTRVSNVLFPKSILLGRLRLVLWWQPHCSRFLYLLVPYSL